MDTHTTRHIDLECLHCKTRVPLDKHVAGCPNCGENILEARYDLNLINVQEWQAALKKRRPGVWRYLEVLPIYDKRNIISLGEGGTPLIRSHALASMLGLKYLYIKDERQGPTNSFKDRQATVAISAMREIGVDEVVVASTGNVAIAYAAYGARAGVKLWAFFPSLTPGPKMREAALYGAEVIKISGSYDETKEIAARFAKNKQVFLDRGIKSVAAIESMKTIAYEIAEDLGEQLEGGQRWRTPDWFFQGVSGGMGPIGVAKGFREMQSMGLVDKLPALGLIQSTGCAPMVDAFVRGQRIATPVTNPQTVIATLATGNPGRAYELLFDYVQENGGYFADATDEEAFDAIRLVARLDGISVEPAAGVMFAGLFKMVQRGIIKPDEVVVLNCSGHTLPVEREILGEQWQKQVELQHAKTVQLPEDKLLSALDHIEASIRRILVIEDSPDAARLIKRLLEARSQNYDVHLADDGRTGLQMMLEIKPDLVITDLMMPDVDGFVVIEAMKSDEVLQRVPIVVITAKELTASDRERLNGQIEMLLQKGSSIDEDFIDSLVDKLE
ncbi:MAG: threonine synthase [Anaerolineae bacterium]|nr:threonine synthase [Anaerolineae bacterium]